MYMQTIHMNVTDGYRCRTVVTCPKKIRGNGNKRKKEENRDQAYKNSLNLKSIFGSQTSTGVVYGNEGILTSPEFSFSH